MYDKLKTHEHPASLYRLNSLSLRASPENIDAPYQFDSHGELVVGGVTNSVMIPLDVAPLGHQQLKITGAISVKMSDFHIDPPSPKIALGLIKTGNQVKLVVDALLTADGRPSHE